MGLGFGGGGGLIEIVGGGRGLGMGGLSILRDAVEGGGQVDRRQGCEGTRWDGGVG